MIFAKKSLGQNFLKSKEALRAIVDAGDIHADDIILEVGPGKGALTELLLTLAGKVIAVEKDARLIPFLQEKFANEIKDGKLDVVENDILEFDPEILKFYNAPYKLLANIPYYITGVFLRKFLEAEFPPSKMVLLLQKEVAERIVARDGKESILSLSVKAYGSPKYVMTVKAKYFSPAPNVDSAVILIDAISKDFFRDISEENFFELVKAGFAHKRKMLAGNLKSVAASDVTEILRSLNINEKARAEDLTLGQWKQLALKLGRE